MKIVDKYKRINEMLNEASTVFVVAHKDLDMDAVGASLAMYQYIDSFGKSVYFILDDVKIEDSVARVLNELSNSVNFVSSNKAKDIKNGDSLLVILDTNKNKLLQTEDLDSFFSKKIVIDHHEESDGSIVGGEFIVDVEASSTCEMITEFLKLNNFVIDKNLATLLLAGIILDTNNYILKTDSNTFYYSYYLTTCGAEPNKVQYLFKQDLRKYIKRQKMITNVKKINNIAVSKGVYNDVYRREELAKTADTLLMFSGIEASFVIAMIEKDVIGISARSMGSINVGKILTMFGGGGDVNFAAAKIENTTIKKVEHELLNIIKLL